MIWGLSKDNKPSKHFEQFSNGSLLIKPVFKAKKPKNYNFLEDLKK